MINLADSPLNGLHLMRIFNIKSKEENARNSMLEAEQVNGGLAPVLMMIAFMGICTLLGAEDGNGWKFWQW